MQFRRAIEGPALRILLIEDDTEAAQYLIKGLGESGYVVDHADDGPQGLMLATSQTYDAMIVDRMLPGLEGLSVLETLRKNGNQTPALILSGKSSVPDRVAGLKAGADDYLTKPFEHNDLLEKVESHLRSRNVE